MKKSNTLLFIIFLVLALVFLAFVNLLQGSTYTSSFESLIMSSLSALLIFSIILSVIYRDVENNKIRDEFVTIITHKFRTPLTGIRWTIDMLQKDLTLLEKKDLLLEMQKANDRLMEIVDLLIGFAKFDKRLSYAFEAISLREIVSVSLNKYSASVRKKNIKFTLDSDRELPLVIIDKAKIQFVVDMLVDNALKYTHPNGSVKTSFEMNKKSITLKVTDTGIGMSYLDSKKVFSHFFRAKNAKLMDTEGLGLGLYTAKRIVDHHGGKLWAESKGIDKGSTFCLQLPIKR